MFKINEDQCKKIGLVIADIPMRAKAFDHLGPALEDARLRACVFLYVSAICHQTETLCGYIDGKLCRGWDYLMGKFIETGRTHPASLTPQSVKALKEETLLSIVSDEGDPETSTLSRVKERVDFLREIGEVLSEKYNNDPRQLYGEGRLGGKDGLYAALKQFSAFGNDPIMKKATVFFMLMQKSELWGNFIDPQELLPMPDYHKMRLFLRTGCIEIDDEVVAANLRNKIMQDIEVDNILREYTAEAYRIILRYTKKDFFDLEVFLWSFARSLCYHKPACISSPGEGNFLDYTEIDHLSGCPFISICPSRTEYWQPVVDTNFH